ncbi:MAG: hypothetical protein FWE15_17970 [Actinomycetia bacterium]|nr:hypothetical protein [Actinomycetes bacterium]
MTDRISTPVQRHRWFLTRACLALACAGIMTVSGLPTLQGSAHAASGMRCDEKYGLDGQSPASSLPWDKGVTQRPEDQWDTYSYDAQRQAMDGLTLPDDVANPNAQQLAAQKKFLEQFPKAYDEYPDNSRERIYARYRDYLLKNESNPKRLYKTFGKWLSNAYILPNLNNHRGDVYERKVVEDLGLVGEDWLCQEDVPILDENGNPVLDAKGKPMVRRFDAVNYKKNLFLEFKAGGGRDTNQDKPNKAFLEDPQRKNARIGYVNGQEKTSATTKYLNRLGATAGVNDEQQPRVFSYEHIADSVPDYTPGKYTKADPYLEPPGENIPEGGAAQVVDGSEPTPEEMGQEQQLLDEQDPEGLNIRGPGGVDFSTIQLSYVGKPVKGQGLNYAFSAAKADEDANLGWGGKAKAQLISDSFSTWLALTPDKFWVNLNPDQPDTVMDATFGKTDAGRVLLQADLAMKHDYARDLDPRKPLGKKLSDAMRQAGLPCGSVERNWIVPEPAQVRADSGGLYILSAPLKVNSVAATLKTPSPNGNCDLTADQRKTSQQLVQSLIIPDIEHKVNTAPQYADLRRVYTARVAAEYVRQQDAQSPGDYHKVINSNDVHRWPLRSPNTSWTPRQTWEDYVKSFTKGDYSFPCEYNGQTKICVMGGVDFSKAPKKNVSQAQFTKQHKNLPRTAKTATRTMADDADNRSMLLLGGGGRPHAGPTPSRPATPPSTGSGKGSGGDLAATGTNVLTFSGIGIVLLGAGAALMWWRRQAASGRRG